MCRTRSPRDWTGKLTELSSDVVSEVCANEILSQNILAVDVFTMFFAELHVFKSPGGRTFCFNACKM